MFNQKARSYLKISDRNGKEKEWSSNFFNNKVPIESLNLSDQPQIPCFWYICASNRKIMQINKVCKPKIAPFKTDFELRSKAEAKCSF